MARLDPEGKDPALRRMVLIGHSQGGLLVKMQAISSGDRIWNAVSRKPLDELQLSDQTRDLLRRGLFVEPLPEVSRVVFICTPHRGSFVAGRNLIANVTRRLLTLPLALTGVAADLARNPDAFAGGASPVMPSAVDNMSPRNPFIRALQEIPVAPSITVNSIIAVEGDGPVEQGERRRGGVRERPHRAGRVRAGRAVGPFRAGQSPRHRGGPPDSPAAWGGAEGHGAARGPMTPGVQVPGNTAMSPDSSWSSMNSSLLSGPPLTPPTMQAGAQPSTARKGPQPGNVRVGATAALSISRHQSIKLYGSTGIYNRTDNDFWAVGIAWQYRWGGGL